MKKTLILGMIFFTASLNAQNLDSLYQVFINYNNSKESVQVTSSSEDHGKCGTPLISEILANYDNFSKSQQDAITAILTPTTMQTSIVSPSGFFRIHYDETGTNAPEYDVNEFAIALDSSYNYEVNILGYPAPPTSASVYDENRYDVYIKKMGYYGQTVPVNSLGQGKRDSYIEVHSSFSGFYTEGIEAAKVTAAHEFHHAIQMGNYIWNSDYSFYYEITSVSMEDYVYDEVDDYIDYLKYYFRYPYVSFSQAIYGGYELAHWNLFLTQKYPEVGFDIIKYSWELMAYPTYQSPVKALANAVEEYIDDSFKNVFSEFAVWNFFTNYRTRSDKYFKDAAAYPAIKNQFSDGFESTSSSEILAERTVSSEPLSNNYLLFFDRISSNDTIYAIVTNGDVSSGADDPSNTESFTYSLLSNSIENASIIVSDKYYGNFESNNSDIFCINNTYNGELVENGGIVKKEIDYSYPQPFKLFEHANVRIPVVENEFGKADLYIYSASMNLVYSGNVDIKNVEHAFVQWDGKDSNGDNVASGVYIYVTDSEDNIKKGKIVILNE